MLFLGHTGLTLAAVRVMEKVMGPGGRHRPGIRPWPPGLIDYRLVLIGSMLPDIIDKPLGGVILNAVASGDPAAELVNRLGPVYDCLDAGDKDAIQAVKDEISRLDNSVIEGILESN